MTATVKTISAVTAGTDTFTATAHGLLTGDRFRLRNVGGALPAATPSLAPATTYFAIRVDNDNVKPAVSSANALAGTAIDITGAGTGTHFIEHGLPYCERRVSAPLTQVFSLDNNEAWEALTALHTLLTGRAPSSIWTRAPQVRSFVPLVGAVTAGTWLFSSGSYAESNSAGATIVYSLPIEAGARVTGLQYAAFGNGTVDATYFLQSYDGAMAAATTLVAATNDDNRGAAWGVVAPTVTAYTIPAAGGSLLFQVQANAAGYRVGTIRVTYDFPPLVS